MVVQGCRLPIFEPVLRACAETWQTLHHPDVDVYVAYGNGCTDHELVDLTPIAGCEVPPVPDGQVVQHGHVLAVGTSDLVAHQSDSLLRKRLLSLAYLLDNARHDAFLLVCASSYVDLDVLADHVADVSLEMRFEGHAFIGVKAQCVVLSGSALLLSRDLAQRLVDDAPRLITAADYRYADDVSLAKWVAAEISDTDPAEMTARHRRGERPTTDNTFVAPRTPFHDYRGDDVERHRWVDGAYHYHFETARPDDMRRFHRQSGGVPSRASGLIVK